MNIKEAIAQTQRRWLYLATGEGKYEGCGFCHYSMGDCPRCPVSQVLGNRCPRLPNYHAWDHAAPDDDFQTTPESRRLARAVLEDVNKIARHYHCKVVPLPPTP